jgi:hypothetical protein
MPRHQCRSSMCIRLPPSTGRLPSSRRTRSCCPPLRRLMSRTHRQRTRQDPTCRRPGTGCCTQQYHSRRIPNRSHYRSIRRRTRRRMSPHRYRRGVPPLRMLHPMSRLRLPGGRYSNRFRRPMGVPMGNLQMTHRTACRPCRMYWSSRGICSCSRRCCSRAHNSFGTLSGKAWC